MHATWKRTARSVLGAAIFACGILQAQTIAVAPTGYVTAGLGGTVQFSAQVTGLMNTSVTWSVGRPGLNTGLGSISATGLYTAPTTLPGNTQILITATSVSTPTVTGVGYVYLLPPGPTLTSVSPSPVYGRHLQNHAHRKRICQRRRD